MHIPSILRVVALAAVLATPFAHASFADEQQSQMGGTMSPSAGDAPQSTGSPYSNDFLMSPPVGN